MNIITQPQLLSFESNPNWLTLEPEQNFGLTTNRGRIDVQFLETLGDETALIEGITFTSRPQIDDTEVMLVLSNDSDPGQVELTARSFVSAFNSNPILNKKWRAEYIGGPEPVRIYSLTDGPKGNLTFETFLTTPVFFVNSVPAVVDYESDAYKNYAYRVEIYSSPFNFPFDIVSDEVKVADLSQAVPSIVNNAKIAFNVNPYSPSVRYLPVFGSQEKTTINRFRAKVYATYVNEFNIPVQEYLTNVPHWFTVMGGQDQTLMLEEGIDKYWTLSPTIDPLTRLLTRKVLFGTNFDTRELLSFIYADQLGYGLYNLRLKVKIRFEDGSNQTVYRLPYAVDTVDGNGLHCWDISPIVLGLDVIETDTSKTIQWYEVEVVASYLSQNTPITKSVRYNVLKDCSLNKYQVMFLNNLGAWETFMFTGVNNLEVLTSQVLFERNVDWDDDATDFNTSVKSNNLTDGLKLNSRYLSREEMVWAKDILTSPYLYLVADDDSLTPVVMGKSEWSWNGVDELYTLNLDVYKSHSARPIEG